MESQQTVCVKCFCEKFPVEVVKAAVLFGVQALGYNEPTDEQMHILWAFLVGSDVSPVFPPEVESPCTMLPYCQLLDTFDLWARVTSKDGKSLAAASL